MSIWTDDEGRRHIGLMVEGRRIHRRLPKGSSANDAKRIESEIRSAFARSVNIPGDPTLSQVMDLYLAHAKTLRSPITAKYHALRLVGRLNKYRASEARQAASALVREMKPEFAPATINRSLSALRKALGLAWESGLTREHYGAQIKRLPENNARDVTLTLADVTKLSNHASAQVRAAIWISLFTGCRRGEILALTQADIGDDVITIRAKTTKTLKTRTVPVVTPLRPWLGSIPLAINFEGLKTGFRRARVAAGMPSVTFHDLRRSCGTLMIQAGVDLYVVSKILGHSSVAVTQSRYAYLQTDRMREGLTKAFG